MKMVVRVFKPNIKFERDNKQMLAAAQLGVTAPISINFDSFHCDVLLPDMPIIRLIGERD